MLDVMLSGMKGYLVCRALGARQIRPPILMLTAKDGQLGEAEGLDLGLNRLNRRVEAPGTGADIDRLAVMTNATLRRPADVDEPSAHARGRCLTRVAARGIGGRGTGLGLSLVSDVDIAHGGVDSISDPPLGGARVSVALPPTSSDRTAGTASLAPLTP